MKYIYTLLSVFILTTFCLTSDVSSQTKKVQTAESQITPQRKSIFQKEKVKAGFGVTVVQTQPEFPGGSDSLLAYLKSHIQYPREAQVKREEGMVFVGFMVDTLGLIK